MNHEHHNHEGGHNQVEHEGHKNHMNHKDHQGHTSHAHDKHAGHSIADFKNRFYVSLALTLPVLILAPLIQQTFRFSLVFPGDSFVSLLISTFIFFYGGYPFLKGAKNEIKNRVPGMMTLITLAISVAYFYSAAVVLGLTGEVFFWELATLIDIMLLGHWIEMKSVMGASMALEKLSKLIPNKAHFKKGEEIIDVETTGLKQGDIILIKPGEKIPVDGIVVNGESFVNEALLTGESKPVSKHEGTKVIGGSLNEDGSLEVRVESVGEDSYLSKVVKLVKEAQASKSKTQALADKAASWLTLIAISVGFITFVAWMLASGDLAFAIERTATVLVITCPHALGLAIPLVAAVSTTLSAQNGLLIRNRTAFENSRKISTVVFDKTGTLTQGKFGVEKVQILDQQFSENDLLRIAASLEQKSEHPIAKAIVKEAQKSGAQFGQVMDFKAIKGKGVAGEVVGEGAGKGEAEMGNTKAIIASPGYLKELGLEPSKEFKDSAGKSGTLVFLVIVQNSVNILAGVFVLSDTIREESLDAVKILKAQGLKTWMLTGDNEQTARSVAGELGLDGYFAEVLPDQKQEKIKELQAKGEFVAMVGDGINDAPALAQADVGIAIGSGTDIAAETADIILVNSNPKDVYSLILFGKATYQKMIQNLGWATGYNVFAIPLAAGVLAKAGILLSPAVGAILMSLSTVVVAVNAKLLRVKR